jgi:hypothetical protein
MRNDVMRGEVVPVAESVRQHAERCARLRTRLLAIPAERAPQLHRLKTAAEVQAELMSAVIEALEELSVTRAPRNDHCRDPSVGKGGPSHVG